MATIEIRDDFITKDSQDSGGENPMKEEQQTKKVIDEDGREWPENEVIIWYMLMPDGSTQYEMVCPYTSKCVEYFLRKDDAIEYAKNHNLIIAEWL